MAVERATLRQCVLWVAFGLEPLEPRFEVLERYPLHLNSDALQRLSEEDRNSVKLAQ